MQLAGSHPSKRRAWPARVVLAGVALAGGWLLGSFYRALLPPSVPTLEPLGGPNGYEELVRIAGRMNWNAIPFQDVYDSTPATCQAFVADNAERLATIRSALAGPSRCPLEYSSAALAARQLVAIQKMCELARALVAERRARAAAGRPREAAECDLDIVCLGNEVARGGLWVEDLVGTAVYGVAAESLVKDLPALDGDDLEFLIARLQRLAAARESTAAVIEREGVFTMLGYGWLGRATAWADPGFYSQVDDNCLLCRRRSEACFKLILAEAAVRRFRLVTGRWPQSLDELVGEYLHDAPIDPFSGRPLVYRRTPDGFLLYSVGANGVDDGGQRTDYFAATIHGEGDYFIDAPNSGISRPAETATAEPEATGVP